MRALLPFIVIGLSTGSLYGLAGLGLVLTYRTSGVFNFAHGALGAGAAYLFFTLHWTWGWPWPVALVLAVTVFGALAGTIIERITSGLGDARTATIMVATIGLLLFIDGLLYWAYGVNRRLSPDFLPTGTVFVVTGVKVTWAQVINFFVGVASLGGLYAFLRRTRLGVAMRGVVAAPELLAMTGTSPAAVRIASWIIGSSFAALTGILIAPSILGMDAFLLTALVVQAFGAVAVGRFTSLPLTYVGGLAVGVLSAVATKYFTKAPLTGLPNVIPFLVLVVVMLVTPTRKLPVGAGRLAGERRRGWRLPVPVSVTGGVVGAVVLLAIPKLVGTRVPVYTAGLAFVIVFLSLSLLTRVSGQISLAHAAFMGVGAAMFSHLAAPLPKSSGTSLGQVGGGSLGGLGHVGKGMPWLLALLVAGLIAGAVGALLALPAMRLSGVYLALATLGFSLLMDNVVFLTKPLFGQTVSSLQGLPAPRPSFGPIHGTDTDFYYVVLAAVVLTAALLVAVRRSRLGRFLRAIADSPTALTSMGLGVNVTRVIVFTTSAFFAGVGGALWAMQVRRVNYISFPSINSLLYLAILIVAASVSGFVTSAFLAAFMLVVMPTYLTSVTFEYQSMLFGAVAVAAALAADRRIGWSSLAARAKARLDRALESSNERRLHSPVRARGLDGAALADAGAEG
jgi:branched-subunit amino acid ABC-type transport system permease component